MSTKHNPSEEDEFWKENNLPKDTTKFVCKDGKPYLSKKSNRLTRNFGNNWG